MTIANLKGSREPSNDSRYPFLIYCSLWRDADVKSLPTVQPLARLQLESGAMQMRNFCSNFCFRGSMASQRSDAVECVHCFAGSMASQRDGAYTSQWTIKFMHCKTCAQIVCEFCMRNHSDCTPWYKTRSSLWRDADTQPLARCRFLAGVDRHPAAGGVGMLHCYHCNEEMLWISTFIKCDICAEIVCRFCVRDHTPDTGCWRGACEVNYLPSCTLPDIGPF